MANEKIFREEQIWNGIYVPTDIDGKPSISVSKSKQLGNSFNLIEHFIQGEDINGYLAVKSIITGFFTFHFFKDGEEIFQIVEGFNSDLDVGALKISPGAAITNMFFVQGLSLSGEAVGTTIGALFAVGGQNISFTILQDASNYFEIDGNLIKNLAETPEGTYTLIIKAEGNATEYIDQITIEIGARALISNINLSGAIVQDTAAVGTSVGALTTIGGESPITYAILEQTLDGDPVDVFEIDVATLKTKALVGDIGDVYTVSIAASDSRDLPPDIKTRVEQFPVLVVEDTFINTRSMSVNGVNKHFDVPYDISMWGNQHFSAASWIKVDTLGGEQTIVSQFGANFTRSYRWNVGGTGALSVNLSETGAASETFTSAAGLIIEDGWHFVAFAFDGVAKKVFMWVDAVSVVDTATGLESLFNSLEPVRIGARGDSTLPETAYFFGLLEEISIYNKTLTQVEVEQIYNMGTPRNIETVSSGGNIISWWRGGDFLLGGNMPDQVGNNDAIGVNIVNGDRSTDVPPDAP